MVVVVEEFILVVCLVDWRAVSFAFVAAAVFVVVDAAAVFVVVVVVVVAVVNKVTLISKNCF